MCFFFQASENLGCVMVFTLVSAAQEFFLQLVEDIKNEIQSEKDRVRQEELRLEELKVRIASFLCNTIFTGTSIRKIFFTLMKNIWSSTVGIFSVILM